MNNSLLNVIIGLCGALIGILAFADEIGQRKSLKFIKSLIFKIIILVLASTIGIFATVKKDINAEIKSKKEQSQNDSINKIDSNESNRRIISAFTDALVKHGLKYDSTERKILTFIKASPNKTNEDVAISVRAGESGIVSKRNNDQELSLKIFFRNYGNYSAYNCNVSIMPLVKKNKILESSKEIKSNVDFMLSTKTEYSLTMDLQTSTMNWNQDTLYLYTKGFYSDYNKTNIKEFRELHVYDYKNNQWKLPARKNQDIIFESLKTANNY